MAEIDKALPNTETVVKVPAEEELVETKEEIVEKKDKQETLKLQWTKKAVRKSRSIPKR